MSSTIWVSSLSPCYVIEQKLDNYLPFRKLDQKWKIKKYENYNADIFSVSTKSTELKPVNQNYRKLSGIGFPM